MKATFLYSPTSGPCPAGDGGATTTGDDCKGCDWVGGPGNSSSSDANTIKIIIKWLID